MSEAFAISDTIELPLTPQSVDPLGEVLEDRAGKDDERFHSVTTVLKALDKPALLYWVADEVAKDAVRIAGSLSLRIEEDGPEATVKWLTQAPYRRKEGARTAAELGTAVHDACEKYALSGVLPEVDDEVRPYLHQFDRWAQRWQPKYLAAEAAVYNRTYGYAGTLDAIAEVGGETVILDYKSSRKSVDTYGRQTKPYPEAALQLAAYRHAEIMATWRARRWEKQKKRYYLLNSTEQELGVSMPQVDGGLAIHITPEHCTARPVRCNEEVFDVFLHVMEMYRWQQGLSKIVIGAPLEGR